MHLELTSLKSLLIRALVLLRPITKPEIFSPPAGVSFPQLPYFWAIPKSFIGRILNQPDPKARVWEHGGMLLRSLAVPISLEFTRSRKCKTSAALLMPYRFTLATNRIFTVNFYHLALNPEKSVETRRNSLPFQAIVKYVKSCN